MACNFTVTAENDIEQIGDYIASDNPARALSFVREIRARCEGITTTPKGARLVPELGEGIRRVPYGNYLIFYTLHRKDVVILRVLHGARNILSRDI